MKIFDSLRRVVRELEGESIKWAIAGGVAACIYRVEPRYTGDIDIVLSGAREDQQGSFVGIDLILPVLPWVEPAIARAQLNKIDFGFGMLPTITPEDLILAKLFAIYDNPDRPYDRDDVISVCSNTPDLDRGYLASQIGQFGIIVATDLRTTIGI